MHKDAFRSAQQSFHPIMGAIDTALRTTIRRIGTAAWVDRIRGRLSIYDLPRDMVERSRQSARFFASTPNAVLERIDSSSDTSWILKISDNITPSEIEKLLTQAAG